ncbi:MAG TPA: TatD family hydrolase [Vicinamibacterales bacterium]|nr:TatD family hydrolase [Vicinamibacterales bacterium]
MIDSHCHLAGGEFEADLPAVVERARRAGLTCALVILAAQDDAELARWQRVRALWPETRAAVGVHPHQAGLFAADPQDAARLVERRLDEVAAVRAIGEIGLDYHYDFAPPDVQQAVFRAQLGVARARGLPVVIHTREAEADTLRILAETGTVDTTGVIHCFTGDAAAAGRMLATGYFVSIPGIVSFPKSESLRDAVRQVPADRLLVETDSPYLAPVPFRGRRNEPAHVVRVAEAVAGVRSMEMAALEALVGANFSRLFRP